ncbi:MAG: hypothetical protein DKM50_05830 [Candidatus Margulisiibacteriota bacterium]|nr:MAG: hypothetical protein A2X43_13040 [Candidatus Margulisbacteria bacterium GWD2_39_127]OGI01104.1 MAG: hypothetical protein A2X42_06790 [Candidatus Margulisbacteria bacterium GWF2_38_17]OGI07336.1 MAG: hypothetical protein A2X41_08570 [Candidatus Margulisbacteria bacterium GWE2_39_32]PZM80067.1 MAG: hypothetical protein DKM50_05830 [Candidatus Margulisiibacteriota bacterium]HAR62862.1 hypothetical protein [Candidatus Margulisiibacteriota bacterium]
MNLPKDLPKISIIIPVRNADRTLDTMFKYIFEIDYPADKTEIIIADGDSTDATVDVTKKWQKEHSNIKFVQVKNCKSPGEARNAAISEVTGKYVLFTDGDCAPNRDWAKKLIAPFFMDPKIGGIGGDVLTLRTDLSNDTESYCEQVHFLSPTGRCGRKDSGYMPIVQKNLPHEVNGGDNSPFFATANVAFSKEAIDKIGGKFWDEKTGEDVDFSLRVMASGYKLYYEIDAIVKHMHRVSMESYLKQWYGYGYGHPLLIKNHSKGVFEVVLQIGRGISFSIPSPVKGIIHFGSFHLMHIFAALTVLSALASIFTLNRSFPLASLLLFVFFTVKYFWPCLKLKPMNKFFAWSKIRYLTNYSFMKGAYDGTKEFGGICIEPSW